ncbi:hypothetical protein SAMN02799630_02151 [Paenibacillus sp. UNCCL117]|uniref:HAD family hydrolase n=1 Tax=unclassified Paenibacillus TaxID=185978 RepID=UPI0008875152|nr:MULTISPECIES: HAD family hydrolase [unclassified Paenibacillus]SDD11990.1 hypothetical protein SAMN04488602_10627 [Paenibacillus sp. cl123]SFW33696.1 hypothetical protein SAMN02799630_02151 [Paenibacillus sp. UNCCL117]
MSNIRLIVSDLDGTLLSESHALTEPVKAAVRQFKASGGLFTIATGRFGPTARHIVEELDIDIPFILCNGSVIADRHQVLAASTLSLQELAPFLLEAGELGVTVMLFEETGALALRRTADVDIFEDRENIACEVVHPQDREWTGRLVQKVLLIGDMPQIQALWAEHHGRFEQGYATIQSEDNYFEIIPPSQSKGTALRKLMELLQVEPSEVLSIGNQMNDLDMIEAAGVGAAVANSHPDLKARASYVCSRSYGEGVVEVMEALNLLNTVTHPEERIQ